MPQARAVVRLFSGRAPEPSWPLRFSAARRCAALQMRPTFPPGGSPRTAPRDEVRLIIGLTAIPVRSDGLMTTCDSHSCLSAVFVLLTEFGFKWLGWVRVFGLRWSASTHRDRQVPVEWSTAGDFYARIQHRGRHLKQRRRR